jgi:hypothetical protein
LFAYTALQRLFNSTARSTSGTRPGPEEWRENGAYGNTIGFANALLTRVDYCRLTLDEAKLLQLSYDYFTGRQIESPFGNPGTRGPQTVGREPSAHLQSFFNRVIDVSIDDQIED